MEKSEREGIQRLRKGEEMRGRFATVPSKPLGSKRWLITLEVEEEPRLYDELKDKELSIDIKKFKKKRSLDANAYCWVLMIQRYSEFDKDDDGYITVTMLSRIPIDKLGGHWREIGQRNEFTSYMRLVGSSEMDSEQMAHFLDGVVSEAKELGIETETPEELERMASLWRAS